jgi:uncharacterized protein
MWVRVDFCNNLGGRHGLDRRQQLREIVAPPGHWLIGSVDWYIVGALLLGSLPGISIGSHVAARISDRFLLPVLASILVLIGLRPIAS